MNSGSQNGDIVPDDTLDLVVVFEDEWLMVVNKPSGMPSHILREGERGTLVNVLVARYPSISKVGVPSTLQRECGIIHRLDIDTSGLMVVAKRQEVFEALRVMLKKGEIDKKYLALCEGEVSAPMTIDFPLATNPKNKRKVSAYKTDKLIRKYRARPATTLVTASSPRGGHSFVTLKADVAGRHQIRAHLAAIGHPLMGDALYGGPTMDGLNHHFLHAHAVSFKHPITHIELNVEIPLSGELLDVLERHA
jgi:23S rRNA pseudouridine1911/1915/1917 synthase